MKKKVTFLLIMSMLLQLLVVGTPVMAEDSIDLKADEIMAKEGTTGGVLEEDESAGDMTVFADEPMPSGETTYILGPDITGTLYDDGQLIINGSGAMYNYAPYNPSPFQGNDTITSVKISYWIKNIGNYMFANCSALTSVDIPVSISTIGDSAFSQCTSLSAVTIYNSTTTIGNYAFYGCSALASVTISPSVKDIGDYAFANCSALTSITIPSSVKRIGSYAFSSCSALASVTIRPSVNNIGDGAFRYCSSLTSISIPASVMHIGGFAFADCSKLTSIEIPASNPNYSSEDGVLFDKNKSILIQYPIGNTRTSYTIPDSVTYIGYSGFEGCTYLTTVIVPESVKTIKLMAFLGCTNLTSAIFADSFKPESIEMKAFEDCSSLTTATIPDTVTNIGADAFSGCSSLTTIINQHKGNQAIGANAFNTNAPDPKTAAAYSANANFINAAQEAGYTLKCLDSNTITFTVTFNSDDGTEVPDTTEVPYNTLITAPTPPTRPGFTFDGWYKEAELKNPWDFETDTVTQDTELYAKWDASFETPPPNPKSSKRGGRGTAPPQPKPVSVITIVNGEEHDAGINKPLPVQIWQNTLFVPWVCIGTVHFNGTTSTIISPKSNLTYAEAAQAIRNLLVKSKFINQ